MIHTVQWTTGNWQVTLVVPRPRSRQFDKSTIERDIFNSLAVRPRVSLNRQSRIMAFASASKVNTRVSIRGTQNFNRLQFSTSHVEKLE